MITTAPRLTTLTREEVDTFFEVAKCALRKPGFTILAAPATKSYGRILVITRSNIGSAPDRNKVKRQLKAIFYEEELFKRGHDIAIVVKKEGLSASFTELQVLLSKAFDNIAHNK